VYLQARESHSTHSGEGLLLALGLGVKAMVRIRALRLRLSQRSYAPPPLTAIRDPMLSTSWAFRNSESTGT